MVTKLHPIFRFVLLFQCLLLSGKSHAQFTFSGVGNYTNNALWTPSYPGTVYPSAEVIINGTCTATDNLFFNGYPLTIGSSGTLIMAAGSGQTTSYSGINVEGNVVITQADFIFRTLSTGVTTVNGNISGIGIVATDVENTLGTGSFSPGYPASAQGTLSFGNYVDWRNKTLNIQLFANGDNDILGFNSVVNDPKIEGILHVTLEGGYVPAIGDQFSIVKAPPGNGNSISFVGKSFGTLDLPTLPTDRKWTVSYLEKEIILAVEAVALPVTLVSFSGVSAENENHLSWTTSQESSNRHFEVERSNTGKNFETIGTVDGAGSTENSSHYTFTDRSVLSKLTYYRLKNVDTDGSFAYSRIISVNNDELTTNRLYPNPVQNELFVDLPSANFDYSILNYRGQILKSGSTQREQAISASGLAPGIYLLKSGTSTFRFLKE